MPFCPSCGAAYQGSSPDCPECHSALATPVPEVEPASRVQNWITVYRGAGVQLRSVEAGLEAQGFSVARLHELNSEPSATWQHRGSEVAIYELSIPESEYRARQPEVQALVAAGSQSVENPDAVREAEEDYDVRGCPRCLLYFHENYTRCPGCEADLVPAVECFEEGQAEPDRVIVGHGTEAAVKSLETRLRDQGFDAQSFEVEGWTVDVVDLPWRELTDRTAEAAAVLAPKS